MRIVSIHPAATEIALSLGLGDELVGVDALATLPAGADVPIVAAAIDDPAPEARLSSRDVLELVRDRHAGTPASLDLEAIAEADPDLVLLPGGSTGSSIRRAITAAIVDADAEAEPDLVTIDPLSIEGILNAVTTVGAMSDAEDEAVGLVEVLRERISVIEEKVLARRDAGRKPVRVVTLEWVDPPVTSGDWVPEMVRRAGGWDLLGGEGIASEATTWDEIKALDPEMIVLAQAGSSINAAVRSFEALERDEAFREMTAVRRGLLFAVDPVYFTRPGPRIVEGIEMLAELFDPDAFIETSPPASWTPIFLSR